jgi:hypothetical protein
LTEATPILIGQFPDDVAADVAAQLDVSLASVSEALSYYYAHINELRELDRENTEAFERVRASSVKPQETVQ